MPFGRLIDNFVQVFIGPSGSYHSAQQLVQSSFIFYLVCTSACQATSKFLRHHTLHNFPFAHDITHYYQNVRRNFSGKLQHLLDVLQGLVILDLVREHGQLLHVVSYDIVKGVAYQTRLESW